MLGPKDVRDGILNKMSIDNVMEETTKISEGYPWRLTGTKAAEDCAVYAVEKMKKKGIDAKLLETRGYLNVPLPASLNMVYPYDQKIPCAACAQIGSTPPEGVTAELVYVGSGGEENYVGKDVRGKIVLSELSYAPARPEKTRIAMVNGAVGLLIMNWGTDENPILSYGTAKTVWGNPTPETIHFMDNTPPVVMIPRPDGIRLKKMLEQGETVKLNLKTKADRDWMKLFIPYAEVKAEKGNGDFVLIAGHMDSWGEGASDNAAGNAIKMEIARVLQQNRHLLKRALRIAMWQGHENGIMEGSTWFVEKNWDDIDEHCAAYFTFDGAGMQGATDWHAESASELLSWHTALEDQVLPGVPKTPRIRVQRTGDQSFFGVGIPALNSWMIHKAEDIKKWNNAILGEWYHSEEDTMKYIDRNVMAQCMRMFTAYAFEMTSIRVLPMNFVPVADEIIGRVYDLQERIKGREDAKELLEMDEVVKYALLFKKKAQGIEAFRQIIESDPVNDETTINKTLKKLSRTIVPALCTVTGRYEQDNYGLSALHYSFPGTESIHKLVSFPSGSHDCYLWSTRARRERNRITDALRHAISICDSILE